MAHRGSDSRWNARRYDDRQHREAQFGASSERAHSRGRSHEYENDRQRPEYADRGESWSRRRERRDVPDYDRPRDSYSHQEARYSRNHDGHYSRRSPPLRYNEVPSSSPEPYPRHPSAEQAIAPSNELKLSGLPRDSGSAISTELIKEQIEKLSKGKVSQVRVISDHDTRQPKGFGFATFHTVDDAISFYEAHKSNLVLYGHHSEKYSIDIAYALNRQRERAMDPEWVCSVNDCGGYNRPTRAVCYKCEAPRDENARLFPNPNGMRGAPFGNTSTSVSSTAFVKNGDSDRSPDQAPSRFLLALGLNFKMTPAVLAKGFAKLYISQVEGSNQQPTKTASGLRPSTVNPQAGAREGSIKRVFLVKDKKSNELRSYGFVEFHSIEDAVGAVAKFNQESRFTISSGEVDVCYPHTGIFRPLISGRSTYSVEINGQQMAYWDETAYVVGELVNEKAPFSQDVPDHKAQQTKSEQPASKKTQKKRKLEEDETRRRPNIGSGQIREFSKWKRANEQASDAESGDVNKQEYLRNLALARLQDYIIDGENPCCMLCNTKFKTPELALRHKEESGLHKSNLLAPKRLSDGLKRLYKRGKIDCLLDLSYEEQASPAEPYIDRAKQRRLEAGQPSKISFSLGGKKPAEEAASPAATPDKGKSMMEKMGWKGSGLGVAGAGEAGVIPVSMYAAGVGLGAEGGKMGDAVEEAGRNTRNDPKEYQEKAREKARARFEKSG